MIEIISTIVSIITSMITLAILDKFYNSRFDEEIEDFFHDLVKGFRLNFCKNYKE